MKNDSKLIRLLLIYALILAPCLELLGPSTLSAQIQAPTIINTNNGAAFTTTTSSPVTSLIGTGVYYHILKWWTGSTVPSTCQIKVETSITVAGSRSDLISNQTCTTSGSAVVATGTYNYIWITVTTLTGTNASVYAAYQGYINTPDNGGAGVDTNVNIAQVGGVSALSSSGGLIIRTTPSMSGYTTDYRSETSSPFGSAVISTTSTVTYTSTTTLLQQTTCNNTSAAGAGVTLTVMSGSSGLDYLIGPNFNIPALGFITLPTPTGRIMSGGIKVSVGTANAVSCTFEGKT